MAISNAQKRATAKYKNAHYDGLNILIPKGTGKILKERATESGISLNQYIRDALDEKYEMQDVVKRLQSIDRMPEEALKILRGLDSKNGG